jgi:hypothetical protein
MEHLLGLGERRCVGQISLDHVGHEDGQDLRVHRFDAGCHDGIGHAASR